MIFIDVYAYRRTVGGSYKPTPKRLANTKCTINLDNSKLGDDKCLQYHQEILSGVIFRNFNKASNFRNLLRNITEIFGNFQKLSNR